MPENQDTAAFTMDDFFKKHGSSIGLDDLGNNTPRNDRHSDVQKSGQEPVNRETQPRAPQPDIPDDEGLELDEDTLKALGLAESSPSSGEGSGDPTGSEDLEGTPEADVDLEYLAKALKLDRESFRMTPEGLKIRAKVDGQEFEVSAEELRKGYQLQSTFTKNHEQFLQQQREWEAARQAQHQAIYERATLLDNMLVDDERSLNQQYSQVNWDDLRTRDPAEYAAMVTEYNQKLGAIRNRRQQVVENFRQSANELQSRQVENLREQKKREAEALANALGWKSKETWETGAARLKKYLVSDMGIPEQQVSQVIDHKTLVVAEKARRYDALMAQVNLAKKKVAEVHKVPSGSSSTVPSSRSARNRKAAEASKTALTRLQKEHSIEAAADYFGTLGGIL